MLLPPRSPLFPYTTLFRSDELAGLQVFVDYGCVGCHGGTALGGDILARFGVVESYWEATREFITIDQPTMPMDVGRFAVTQDANDLYVFKAPSLRNITRTYPYFHDCSVWSLRNATQLMARFRSMHLSCPYCPPQASIRNVLYFSSSKKRQPCREARITSSPRGFQPRGQLDV